jgi:hypothetical protein
MPSAHDPLEACSGGIAPIGLRTGHCIEAEKERKKVRSLLIFAVRLVPPCRQLSEHECKTNRPRSTSAIEIAGGPSSFPAPAKLWLEHRHRHFSRTSNLELWSMSMRLDLAKSTSRWN